MDALPNPKRRMRLALWVIIPVLVFFVGCGGLFALVSYWIEEAKMSHAQLGCISLATNTEAYVQSDANRKHELPNTLKDLVNPPFGGSPFLRNGDRDLLDPWGQQYQMERATKPNGDKYIIVKTTAPDGTPISQFGIGPNATLRLE